MAKRINPAPDPALGKGEDKKVTLAGKTTPPEIKIDQPQPKEVNEFIVRAKFLRIAPRKVRLLANFIRGLTITEVETQLSFSPKRASIFLKKILKEAVATADHNYNLKKENLYIKKILVNEGPTLHRFRPAAHGAAHPIRKRSTHLEMVIAKSGEEQAGPKKSKGLLKKLGLKKSSSPKARGVKNNGTKS